MRQFGRLADHGRIMNKCSRGRGDLEGRQTDRQTGEGGAVSTAVGLSMIEPCPRAAQPRAVVREILSICPQTRLKVR